VTADVVVDEDFVELDEVLVVDVVVELDLVVEDVELDLVVEDVELDLVVEEELDLDVDDVPDEEHVTERGTPSTQ
jgi:hypothetical protein